MSRFWKLALCAALTLQTAWTTVVHARTFDYCAYSLSCATEGCNMGTYTSGGTVYSYIDVKFVCGSSESAFLCPSNVIACAELTQFQSNCTDYTSYLGTASIPKLLESVGCSSTTPGDGSYFRFSFALPDPPAGGTGYYEMEVYFYEGTSCDTQDAPIGVAFNYLRWNAGVAGWSEGTCH
jgi:hypothetical protein